MKSHLGFSDLIVEVTKLQEESQGLSQSQIDTSIKKKLSLNTSEYWELTGLSDEMNWYFDE